MRFKYFSIVASICLFAVTSKAKTIYVDDNASAGEDRTSWASANKYLQNTLASAEYGDEIWVAEGTYKPYQGTGKTAGDRASPFCPCQWCWHVLSLRESDSVFGKSTYIYL